MQQCIEVYGVVVFQNDCDGGEKGLYQITAALLKAHAFLCLWRKQWCKKCGVRIGTCDSQFLCDIYLASVDKKLNPH